MYSRLNGSPGTRLIMSKHSHRLALATIIIDSSALTADDLAVSLSDTYGVMVRSGFHCAHPLFDHYDARRGALRASAYVYNTANELAVFADALLRLIRLYCA